MSQNNDDAIQIEKIDLDKVDWKSSREFFESLGEALDRLDDRDESYDFTWVGKRKAIIEAGSPINKTLRPNVEESKDWDSTENLFIEGDNLDALKLLQESYLGKIKMIYIDPPYNTGKDFVYHDNFRASTEDYDEDTEYKDQSGKIQFKKNEKTNGRYHSDWLSMMYPRLKLARNLLSDEGVMFISIDDNEQANLKKLCDEIFGEANFYGTITWINRTKPKNMGSSKYSLQQNTEYILVYGRVSSDSHNFTLPVTSKKNYPEKDELGNYRIEKIEQRKNIGSMRRDGMLFEMFGIKPKEGYRWQLSLIQKKKLEKSNRLFEKAGSIYKKIYEQDEEGFSFEPFWTHRLDTGTAETANEELEQLMEHDSLFETVKPQGLIKQILSFNPSDAIVLDFFSGSGSTAHAVMQLNAEDGGARKHIQVQLPEETDEKSEARKARYRTIPEMSRERIRRAGEKIKEDFKDELAKREKPLDVGFRALTISDTNNKDIFKPSNEQTQESLLDAVDNIKDDRSDLDILFGVLIQSAFELNRPIEKKDIIGSDVYMYDYFGDASGLIACLADDVSVETIKEIAKLQPLTAVFKDSSFKSSQDKVNLAEYFRVISPDTKVKVV